jgi:spore maturation protein CgeB
MDWGHIPSLVYRFIEATVAGSLLIAPEVPGVRRYFVPGKHFVSFDGVEDAIEKIAFYLENHEQREKIAECGRDKAVAIIKAKSYWVSVDSALGCDSIQ